MATKMLGDCVSCGYPIAASSAGEHVNCPNCQTLNEAMSIDGGEITQNVSIPTPLFVGLLGFGLGMFLGPALIAGSDVGRRWLEQKARGG